MEGTLAEILAWLEPRALLLALVMPPVIRVVGHFIPEEPFMVAMGVLAATSGSTRTAAVLLTALMASHLVTDQVVYLGGRWLRPRLGRFPRIRRQLEAVTARLEASPGALMMLIPARVLPLGRGAWLAGCGVANVRWGRFLLADLCALTVHLLTWSGLGWWLAGDLRRLESTAHAGRVVGIWVALFLLVAMLGWFGWRRWQAWQPATVRVARRIRRTLRQLGRND